MGNDCMRFRNEAFRFELADNRLTWLQNLFINNYWHQVSLYKRTLNHLYLLIEP